jgi:hypothetical protein
MASRITELTRQFMRSEGGATQAKTPQERAVPRPNPARARRRLEIERLYLSDRELYGTYEGELDQIIRTQIANGELDAQGEPVKPRKPDLDAELPLGSKADAGGAQGDAQ